MSQDKILELMLLDEQATLNLGAQLAACSCHELVVYLEGPLGAGKTTFVRGFLHALGHKGAVKSPTFTVVEPYFIKNKQIYHFDLFRLVNSEELDYIGIRDYSKNAICLVEWPEKGGDFLPLPDLIITFKVQDQGRFVTIRAISNQGIDQLRLFKKT